MRLGANKEQKCNIYPGVPVFLLKVWFEFLSHLSWEVSDSTEVIRSQSCGATGWRDHTSP